MHPGVDFTGMKIIPSVYLTEAGEPYPVRRSWRARLFSRPWRPWVAERMVTPQVPMNGGYRLADGSLVMHPAMIQQLHVQLASDSSFPPPTGDQ